MTRKEELSIRDLKILCAAQFDADQSAASLASKLRLHENTVRRCLKRGLEEKNLYRLPVINPMALGFNEYLFYFSLANVDLKERERLLKRIMRSEHTSFLLQVGGSYQFTAGLFLRTPLELPRFCSEVSGKGEGIITRSSLVMSSDTVFFGRRYFLSAFPGIQPVEILTQEVKGVISKLDHEILRALNARPMPQVPQIARALNSSSSTINYRMKRLFKIGVIERFIYSFARVNQGIHRYRLRLSLGDPGHRNYSKLLRFARANTNVVALVCTVGASDYELRVETNSAAEVAPLIDRLSAGFGNIHDLESVPVYELLQPARYPFKDYESLVNVP